VAEQAPRLSVARDFCTFKQNVVRFLVFSLVFPRSLCQALRELAKLQLMRYFVCSRFDKARDSKHVKETWTKYETKTTFD
jgi:uncharacterized alpha-E superfamily protein